MEQTKKGIIFTLIAQIFGLGYWIFATIGFKYFNLYTLTSFWFGSATIFSILMIIFLKKLSHFKKFKKYWKWILIMGTLNTGSILTGWKALEILGPSLTSFISNIEVLFVIIFGIILLSDKFNLYEIISGIIIIMGLFITSYSSGEYHLFGILLIIIHSIFFALSRIIIKSKLKKIDASNIVFYRAIIVTLFISIIGFITNNIEISNSQKIIYITFPSIFSVVLQHLFIFKAYKLIEISKVQLYSSLMPLLVLITSFMIFKEILTINQIIGGITILIGVLSLIYHHNKK